MKRPFCTYRKACSPNQMRITLSTMLTIVRIFLIPIIVCAVIWRMWGMAFILFILAMITDLLDGYCARLRNEQTFLGACLDPIADKLLLISCFTVLSLVSAPLIVIPEWFVLTVLIKEALIVFGAALLLFFGKQSHIKPTMLGKITAAMQMLFIVWLFSCHFFYWQPIKTYWLMLSLLLLLALASLMQYLFITIDALKSEHDV